MTWSPMLNDWAVTLGLIPIKWMPFLQRLWLTLMYQLPLKESKFEIVPRISILL